MHTCRQKFYLRNHIAGLTQPHRKIKAIGVNKHSCDDQEFLRVKVDEWKKKSSNSNYFLRIRDDISGCKETKFLFIHQHEWQRKRLLRYGGESVLMDTTYKTTKYATPLFFSLCSWKYRVHSCGRVHVTKRRLTEHRGGFWNFENVESMLEPQVFHDCLFSSRNRRNWEVFPRIIRPYMLSQDTSLAKMAEDRKE